MSGVLLVHQAWLTRRNVERSAAKPRGPKPFEACAAGQTFCTRQTVAASLLLCLRGWNSGWGDLTLRHAPASGQRRSCAWLDGSQGRAGLLSSMDAKGQCRALSFLWI